MFPYEPDDSKDTSLLRVNESTEVTGGAYNADKGGMEFSIDHLSVFMIDLSDSESSEGSTDEGTIILIAMAVATILIALLAGCFVIKMF